MEALDPQEERDTTWRNPLSVPQNVDVFVGGHRRPTRYTVPPGGTKQIPSRYDHAIHQVHSGVILGGIAPQLVNVDKEKDGTHPKLLEALDTEASSKREAEAQLAAASLVQRQIEQVATVAAAKVASTQKK